MAARDNLQFSVVLQQHKYTLLSLETSLSRTLCVEQASLHTYLLPGNGTSNLSTTLTKFKKML